MTKLEIINETAAFYMEDVGRRASANGNCMYNYKEPRAVDKRCAVGRCMTEEAIAEHGSFSGSVINLEMAHGLEHLLKSEYRGHDNSFWLDLQAFHDAGEYWVLTKISERGTQLLGHLRQRYA